MRVVSSGEAAAQENGEDHDFKVDHFDSDVGHKSEIGWDDAVAVALASSNVSAVMAKSVECLGKIY